MESSSGLILIIIGVGLIMLYCKCADQISDQHGKTSINGTVIDTIKLTNKKYLLTIKYKIDEKEYINTISSKINYPKDSKTPIIYNKKNPNKIKLDLLKSYWGDGEGQLFGMVCMYFCIPMILFALVGVGFEYIIKN